MPKLSTTERPGQDSALRSTRWRNSLINSGPAPKAGAQVEPLTDNVGVDLSKATFERHAALLGGPLMSQQANGQRRGDVIRQIQRDYGNRYVQRLVEHVRGNNELTVQTKLTVGAAGDKYEREADEVAKRVTGGLAPPESRESRVRRIQDETLAHAQRMIQCRRDIELIRRKSSEENPLIGMEGGGVSAEVSSAIEGARGGGQALPANVRTQMEQGFNADFGGVRVHDDSRADALSRSMSASAFTTGQDIFFGQGNYKPDSQSGKELLAHELTHVVQQSGADSLHRKPENDVQRNSLAGLTTFAGSGVTYTDLGNGLWGSDRPVTADDVEGLVTAIRNKAAESGEHQNIKVLTGTHGSSDGDLIGEADFYREDQALEGHKDGNGGWITVLKVLNKKKSSIEGWKNPARSAIILAWCYSQESESNWANLWADWSQFGPDGDAGMYNDHGETVW